MKATRLYSQLEKDFITSEMSDEWAQYMDSVTVAVVAGGGNDVDILQEVFKAGVSTFVTGIAAMNELTFPTPITLSAIIFYRFLTSCIPCTYRNVLS